MKSINRITLIGHLTNDPVDAQNWTIIDLMTEESPKKFNHHKIICFQELRSVARRLKKGDSVYIEGQLNGKKTDLFSIDVILAEIAAKTIFSLD